MTFGNDTARAAPSSSGWAVPADSTLKKSPDKWLFWLLPFCYAVLYAIINWLSDEYVQTPPAETGLPQLPRASGPLRWIGYALTPLYVFMKIGFTTVCLALGAAIVTWNVRFSSLFHAASLSEIVWIAAALIHLACLLFYPGTSTFFYPLSVENLVEIDQGNMWASYLFRTLNLFEVAYAAALVYTIRLVTDNPPRNVALLVVVSYGGGMALLVAGFTFFLLSVF